MPNYKREDFGPSGPPDWWLEQEAAGLKVKSPRLKRGDPKDFFAMAIFNPPEVHKAAPAPETQPAEATPVAEAPTAGSNSLATPPHSNESLAATDSPENTS
jgi:hypothetical protein